MCGFGGSKRVECMGVGGPLDHGGVVPSARKGYGHSFADAPSHRGREDRHNPANFC